MSDPEKTTEDTEARETRRAAYRATQRRAATAALDRHIARCYGPEFIGRSRS
jgi:hypothetical protein